MRRRSPSTLAAFLVTAALALAAPGTPAAAAPAVSAVRAAPAAPEKVTLVTGDVVTVTTDDHGVEVATVDAAAPGGIEQQMIGGDLYVIPERAQPLLASGRVDRRLFNVTRLLEQEYDDAHRADLPVIAGWGATRAARPAPAGSRKVRDLTSIGASALSVRKNEADRFWTALVANPAAKLWLDGRVEADLAESTAQIGAPQAWAQGVDGTGATVAVLDSGADLGHPDLAGQVTEAVSFVPGEEVTDVHGHGTHVASTVAGSGAGSDGRERGVAPGADLLIGKVLDDSGYGLNSWIIAGMEWAAHHADVVNMSLGTLESSDGTDPMSQAVNRLTAETGTLFVVAAGNNYYEETIGSPGAADAALTVAAVDADGQRAYFSSMGPRIGDGALKPDVAAPGVGILAARSQHSWDGEGLYTTMDGTSMAAPHVAGAAALLASQHPDWTAGRLKNALMSTASTPGASAYEIGTGTVDVPAALGEVHATGSVSFGFFGWPHEGDPAVTRTITYTNDGSAPITLALSADLPGARLSTPSVEVPAGGSSAVTLTADPDDVAGVGRKTGFVVATDQAGAVRTRTAAGFVKEEERYDLRFKVLDREGDPAGGYVTLYRYGDDRASTIEVDPETGEAGPFRLAPGDYDASMWLGVTATGGGKGVAQLGTPNLVLDKDRTLVMDARATNPITLREPKTSEDVYRRVQYYRDSGIGGQYATFLNAMQVPSDVDEVLVAPTGPVAGTYELLSRWSRATPALPLTARTPRPVPFDPLYMTNSTRLDGPVSLRGVYAGTGAAEYSAPGAAAIIDYDPLVSTATRNEVAARAGAKLLVVVNDGPSRYDDWSFGPVPTVSVSSTQGRALVAAAKAGKLTLKGVAKEFPDETFELVKTWQGQAPKKLNYAPRLSDLARVDQRFVRTGTPTIGYDLRADCRPYQWPPCVGVPTPVKLGAARTDWYTAGPTTGWYQDVRLLEGWEQRHDQVNYRPGQREERTWFGPVTRPRLGPGYWGPYRQGDFLAVSVPSAGGSGLISGALNDSGTVTSRLYQNGTLVGREQPDFAVQTEVPPTDGPATYRFEQDTERDAATWGTSTRTKSVWVFRSEAPAEGTQVALPLMQIGFDLRTDLAGTVRRAEPQRITLTSDVRIRTATLQLSYDDGVAWRAVKLSPQGEAVLRHPAGAKHVSLRVEATDGDRNTVTQEIIRAYLIH
ncbi:subtilisin family serine protease [Actinoplanes lutulentus]|uniref:Subtilisin family serine protease n=1 Tax=Actinoplanes lutulentus TaxID=1287878 RepID=A0A327ZFF7_9ACTN|nr:S8 family serine peptidase [Actinoplanes lutulentus]MBB2942886.1 subtilisin family serine protease [Actinoplanes lutulentus]RAK38464.1 subtilisin family serine protease [Actinoplanes lutulentus]